MVGNFLFASILLISFGLLMALLMSAAGVDFRSIFGNAEKIDNSGRHVASHAAAHELNAMLLQSIRLMRDALHFDENDELKAQIALLRKTRVEREEYLDFLEQSVISDQGLSLVVAIVLANKVCVGSEEEFIRLAEADQMKEARAELLSRTCPAQWGYLAAVDALIQFQESEG